MKTPVAALIYDFDKTLCTKDMQEYGFIPSLGMTAEAFWREVNALTDREQMDNILAYMYLMVEKNRERIEIRTAYTSDDASWLCGREKWKNLRCIGAIRKEVEADGKRTEEWHYYISSRRLSAEELLHHARMEWAVESMHWLLDVHYGEDYCRIANKAAQQNLRRHRTTRRRVGRCLFRHLRHANSSIYLQ